MSDEIAHFVTPRLLATRLTPAHFDEISRLHRDPAVMQTLSADGRPLPDEATRAGLDQAREHWETRKFGLWAFHDRHDDRFVGRGGLKVYAIDGLETVGLAYAVVSERFGHGFATEMAAASLEVAFDRLGLLHVDSWTLPINRASQRVMEKLGFRFVRDFEFATLPHRYYRLAAPVWYSGAGMARHTDLRPVGSPP
jgi:ribosomal-protein-alanine N-acetyltransferase